MPVSQSVSQSGRQAGSQTGSQGGRQSGRQADNLAGYLGVGWRGLQGMLVAWCVVPPADPTEPYSKPQPSPERKELELSVARSSAKYKASSTRALRSPPYPKAIPHSFVVAHVPVFLI